MEKCRSFIEGLGLSRKNVLLKGENKLNLERTIMYSCLLAAGCVAAYYTWSSNNPGEKQVAVPDASPTIARINSPPDCRLAAGYIWANVTLYQDSACKQPFAKIVSATRKEVSIQLNSGEVETKTRDAVKNQAYVMTNDPAIP